jgi:lipid-A-disaccharide synthase
MGNKDFFLVCGEPSGDLHGAQLVAALQAEGEYAFGGVGGRRLAAQGVELLADSTSWGAIGVVDALRRVPYLYVQAQRLLRYLRRHPPGLLILVDFGAFNVWLAHRLRRQVPQLPILYYFPPSSWDRSERDRSPLAQLTDAVATPFPWSAELLRHDGVNAHFVGHPVVERVLPATAEQRARQRTEWGLAPDQQLIGLLPGSRVLERNLLTPTLRDAACRLAQRGDVHFLWSAPPGRAARAERRIREIMPPQTTVVTDSLTIFQTADLVFSAFGTATLEAAAALCPMITLYRGNWFMRLQFKVMKLPTTYYAMPNIIANSPLVPELVQDQATPERLAAEARRLLDDQAARQQMRDGLAAVREQLGPPGAARRTADLARELWAQRGGGQ